MRCGSTRRTSPRYMSPIRLQLAKSSNGRGEVAQDLGGILWHNKIYNNLFAAKNFEIPQYQRSYSWDRANVRELFEDLIESIETGSSHYIGTIVLAKATAGNRFLVVDGQQRLTTITIFLSVIVSKLSDNADKEYWTRYYVRTPERHRLEPLLRDRNFYFSLLEGVNEDEPQSKSQRCLREAFEEICILVKQTQTPAEVLLDAFGSLEILQFIEDNEIDAIRIFQTVNDRGKELSRMDKMKSLIFYFSARYCSSNYNDAINDCFAEILNSMTR